MHFSLSLLQNGNSIIALLPLGLQLGTQNAFLLLFALNLLIHRVNQQILFLLGLFQVLHVFFCSQNTGSRDCYGRHHLFIMVLNLLQSAVQLGKFVLSFEMFLLQLFYFRFFLHKFIIQNIMFLHHFLLQLDHQVEVFMRLFKTNLGFSQLLLHGVKLHSDIFLFIFDLLIELLF